MSAVLSPSLPVTTEPSGTAVKRGKAAPAEGYASLWDRGRRANPKAPDWRGEVKLHGRIFEMSGWSKVTANGHRWISIRLEAERFPLPRRPRRDGADREPSAQSKGKRSALPRGPNESEPF